MCLSRSCFPYRSRGLSPCVALHLFVTVITYLLLRTASTSWLCVASYPGLAAAGYMCLPVAGFYDCVSLCIYMWLCTAVRGFAAYIRFRLWLAACNYVWLSTGGPGEICTRVSVASYECGSPYIYLLLPLSLSVAM